MDKEVKRELPGTFYRSPEPGGSPYAIEGDAVAPDTVIGVVELMKQFNEVSAGASGTLRKFLVTDGDAVETDMALAIIDDGRATR